MDEQPTVARRRPIALIGAVALVVILGALGTGLALAGPPSRTVGSPTTTGRVAQPLASGETPSVEGTTAVAGPATLAHVFTRSTADGVEIRVYESSAGPPRQPCCPPPTTTTTAACPAACPVTCPPPPATNTTAACPAACVGTPPPATTTTSPPPTTPAPPPTTTTVPGPTTITPAPVSPPPTTVPGAGAPGHHHALGRHGPDAKTGTAGAASGSAGAASGSAGTASGSAGTVTGVPCPMVPTTCPPDADCATPMIPPGPATGPPAVDGPSGCPGPYVVELSTDGAVATVSADAAAAGPPSIVGTGSFGTAEGSPAAWVAVGTPTGVATVRLSANGDQMAPVNGVAVLAADATASLAGTTVDALDAAGNVVASLTVPSTSASPVVGCGGGSPVPEPAPGSPPVTGSATGRTHRTGPISVDGNVENKLAHGSIGRPAAK
ncbi:MAG TPA: hypothetical protein VKG43_06040 [Acidimicrobiales bacterium]|nr:hypothetical protein [Acidimicrobiales bacterium]